jgi:hypothetical protein
MSTATDPYLNLLTHPHRTKPLFVATVEALLEGVVGARDVLAGLPEAFSVDAGVGAQLDRLGEWVGRTRFLDRQPVVGVFELGDSNYRTLLQAVIAANNWDGTIPGAYAALSIAFAPTRQPVIEDHGDLTMTVGLAGPAPDAVLLALLTGGYLDLRPAGISVHRYAVGSGPGPLFGFGAQSSGIAGFGTGYWATVLPPS